MDSQRIVVIHPLTRMVLTSVPAVVNNSPDMNSIGSRLGILLVASALGGSASAQSNNLLKNPNGEDALKSWTVAGNAAVTDCFGADKCFSLTQDAFVYQDVEIAQSTPGTVAVLISFSSIEEPNASQQQIGRPYLFGYFMNSREVRTAKILANLSGQEMSKKPSSSGEWVTQSGVFKIAEGTQTIRIFLRSGCRKSEASATCSSHFRKPGIFLFNSEAEAKAFISTYQ